MEGLCLYSQPASSVLVASVALEPDGPAEKADCLSKQFRLCSSCQNAIAPTSHSAVLSFPNLPEGARL